MTVEKNELEVLEGKLDGALTEAETKTAAALESVTSKRENFEKDIWAAAEATEFASLVYALTYDLQDSSGGSTISRRETETTLTILSKASQDLKTVQAIKRKQDKDSLVEGYKLLRGITVALRNEYLALTRASASLQSTT
jgi:hypothetical protein